VTGKGSERCVLGEVSVGRRSSAFPSSLPARLGEPGVPFSSASASISRANQR